MTVVAVPLLFPLWCLWLGLWVCCSPVAEVIPGHELKVFLGSRAQEGPIPSLLIHGELVNVVQKSHTQMDNQEIFVKTGEI